MGIIEDEDLETMLASDFLDMWYQGRCGRRTNLIPQREKDMYCRVEDLLSAVENTKAVIFPNGTCGFEADEPILRAALKLKEFFYAKR